MTSSSETGLSPIFVSSSGIAGSLPPDTAFSNGVLETMRAQGGRIPLLSGHMARLTRSACPAPPIVERIRAQATSIARQTANWEQGARVRLRYGVLDGERVWDFTAVPLETGSPWERGVSLALCRTRVTEEASISPFETGNGDAELTEARIGAAQDAARGCKLLHRKLYHRAEQELGTLAAGLDSSLFHEGLLLDANDHVIEGLRSNLLVWRDGHWSTPDLRYCGVRGVMLSWLAGRVEIREDDLLIEDIEQAEEVAVCNAVRGVVPVVQLALGGSPVARAGGDLSIAPETSRLRKLIASALW